MNRKIDPTFLQKQLGDMLGMNKQASGASSAERLAVLTKQARDNMEVLRAAMDKTAVCSTGMAKTGSPDTAADLAAVNAKKEEIKKAALADIQAAVAAFEAPSKEAELMKSARRELIQGILTDQLIEPYDALAKKAGVVTLYSLCRS